MRVRTTALLGLGMAAAALLATSAAWACTFNVAVNPLSVLAGPPGTEVTVTGLSPTTEPVQIRWNGLSGPVLATVVPRDLGERPMTFSASVKIPDALPGVHYLVAVGDNGNTKPSWTRAAFRIPRSGPALGQGDPVTPDSSPQPLWSADDTSGSAPDGGLGAGLVLLGIGGGGLVAAAALLGLRRHRVLAEDDDRPVV